jgi:hypothetical protein
MGGDPSAVGALTQIVDHGSSTDRYDIVLVAEGFAAGDQQLWFSRAAEFASALFEYSPFSSIEAELAVNVWRLDVVSQESGLDDPIACPGGTGAEPVTYFDASRCGDGVQRQVDLNWDLVELTVDGKLINWNVILVIINSELPGGSADHSKHIAALTTSQAYGSWILRALHELGHSGFALADEYETPTGCKADPPDSYSYTGAEPMRPNITTNSSLATIKWGSLLTPNATVWHNQDCSKCNPATNPLRPGMVGAFEGADQYHCGIFRPAWDCRMRHRTQDFCSVCTEWILDTLVGLTGFQTWPEDNVPDATVDPWSPMLTWTPGGTESAWELQVTDQLSFTGAAIIPATQMTDQFGLASADWEIGVLKPDTQYQWRVRKVTAAGHGAWTRPRTFVTTDKKVQLKSPKTDDDSSVQYPWGLPFSWLEVDGAAYYEIEISDAMVTDPSTNQLVPDWSNLIFPTVESDIKALTKTLDVKVNATLHWHARAIPSQGANYAGVWSDPFPLVTSWPGVTILSPADGDPVYPWPVRLRWSDVKGAVRYLVELDRQKDQWGPESYNKPLDFVKGALGPGWPKTQVDLNLVPRPFADNETHAWRVRVWGPPPLNDEGQDSGLCTFVNNGDETIPVLIDCADSPGSSGADGIHWMGTDGVVAVAWYDVENAEAYYLQLTNFGDSTTDPDGIAYKDKVFYEHQYGYLLFGGDLQPKPSVGVTGYWWKATALGPEGLLGLDDGTPGRRCYVLPDAPELLEPAPAGIDDPGDYGDIAFTFASAYTPSGNYRVVCVWGPPVSGAHPDVPGNPGGITQFGPSALGQSGLEPNTSYQWMVKAQSGIPKAAGGVAWAYPFSEMRTYVTKPFSQPLPAPQLITFTEPWLLSTGFIAFERVPGAFHYEAEWYGVDPADDQTAIGPLESNPPKDNSLLATETNGAENATGLTAPWNVFVMLLDGTDPNLHYRVQVRACAGTCGQPSPWGLYHPLSP